MSTSDAKLHLKEITDAYNSNTTLNNWLFYWLLKYRTAA